MPVTNEHVASQEQGDGGRLLHPSDPAHRHSGKHGGQPCLDDLGWHAKLSKDRGLDQARAERTDADLFAALFKSVVGVPPLTYIATWRIYRAKLILASGHSIAAAAEQTGYGSDIALSRAFKTTTGMSPGQWRRERRTSARNDPPPDRLGALGLTRG